MYVLVAIVVLVGLWLGYAFVQGFIQGFCEAMRRENFRVMRWEDDDSPRNL
ncbi:MAG: hypothetical protein ABSF26_31120 [Thermoguttaceae bacterium]|jgi:hypothetical protein